MLSKNKKKMAVTRMKNRRMTRMLTIRVLHSLTNQQKTILEGQHLNNLKSPREVKMVMMMVNQRSVKRMKSLKLKMKRMMEVNLILIQL